ncbi:MAG TPA: type II secretion system protein [Candidatus Eisenbacteria bacterium]|nr:type II secretion system protein [Candidatus Eisenbacteria bacterium]
MQKKLNSKGFTLIELLIVIGIIGFLAAAVLVAVDPVKRIQDSRDARRYSEANAVLNAVLTKQADDRKLYGGSMDAPIITSATKSQVIVTSDSGIECDTATAALTTESFPGCMQTLDNAARTITGNAASASAVVTGTGTNFLTSVRVGDTLYDAATNGLNTCTVLSIASDTALTCVAAPATPWSTTTIVAKSKNCVVDLSDAVTLLGTATNSGTAVTGTGTNFTAQVTVGDTLSNGTTSCVVSAIASATSLTCSPAPTWSGATLTDTLANPLTPNYIASMPLDPRGSGTTICTSGCTTNAVGVTTVGTNNTGYYLHRTSGNRIEIGACAPEQAASINVKR